MSRRSRTAVSTLLGFIAGAFFAIGMASLMGAMQYQDAQDAEVVERVIACSQVADMCSRK